MRKIVFIVSVFILLTFLTACTRKSEPLPTIINEPGQITQNEDVYGSFYTYIPKQLSRDSNILVVIHGTPLDGTPEENGGFYAEYWQDFAEDNNLVLIMPVFDQEHFSSRYGEFALGGYRGLFGTDINADAWVLRLVHAHRETLGLSEQPFLLYGHSAGGQFTARFWVTHPDKLRCGVITSAATYPQPDASIAWPFGIGELDSELVWEDGTVQEVQVKPDKAVWLNALQTPLTVLVGLDDTTEIPQEYLTGQRGSERVSIARHWVMDMHTFAEENQIEDALALELVPGIGHSMVKLLPFSQAVLEKCLVDDN